MKEMKMEELIFWFLCLSGDFIRNLAVSGWFGAEPLSNSILLGNIMELLGNIRDHFMYTGGQNDQELKCYVKDLEL